MLDFFISKCYLVFSLWDEAFIFLLRVQTVHSGPVAEKEFVDLGSAASRSYPPHSILSRLQPITKYTWCLLNRPKLNLRSGRFLESHRKQLLQVHTSPPIWPLKPRTYSSHPIRSGYYSPFHETHTEYHLIDLLAQLGFETASHLWKNVRDGYPFYTGVKAEEAYFF